MAGGASNEAPRPHGSSALSVGKMLPADERSIPETNGGAEVLPTAAVAGVLPKSSGVANISKLRSSPPNAGAGVAASAVVAGVPPKSSGVVNISKLKSSPPDAVAGLVTSAAAAPSCQGAGVRPSSGCAKMSPNAPSSAAGAAAGEP